MQHILDKLSVHADASPDNTLLRYTITVLRDIQRRPDGPYPVSWSALHRDFQLLQDRGLWERSTENDELLDALRILLTSPSNKSAQALVEPHRRHSASEEMSEEILIAVPAAQSISSQLVANQGHAVLPIELIDILNHAYFLHLLATNPTQVLPPGKSLLSVMSYLHVTADGNTKPTLHSKVEDLVHKAFWDGVVDSLSNPEPSVQLSRIKLLYEDIHVTLSPLLPPKHPVLVTLTSPLSPTSSPLDSALIHLREVLASLRERCAPARDPEIEAIQRLLDDPPIRSPRPVALATLVTETVRNILKLSEIMKDDLSHFVLGSMSEHDLRSVVTKQAKTKEREIVIDIWRRDGIMQGWASWLTKSHPPDHLSTISAEKRFLWIVCIVQALGLPSPAFCPLPSRILQRSPLASPGHDGDGTVESFATSANILPPVFFFSLPALLKIQNYLQALVIAASLSSLAPAPTHSSTGRSDSPDPDSFMFRVWTLLRAEIAGEPGTGDTKLINLADELVRARKRATATPSTPIPTPPFKEDDATLRAAVDRTLRPDDPVYKLLQRRLLTELSSVLVKRRQGEATRDAGGGYEPTTLRTGRVEERAGRRPRLVLNFVGGSRTPPYSSPLVVPDVRGFEDPVLSQAIAEVFEQVDNCLGWVESVWNDIIMTGDITKDNWQ